MVVNAANAGATDGATAAAVEAGATPSDVIAVAEAAADAGQEVVDVVETPVIPDNPAEIISPT